MIVSKTPLRISLVGGGSDFPYYYTRYGPGKVLSLAIDKYMYVIVKSRFDGRIHLGYSKVEEVDLVNELQHDIIKYAMIMSGVYSGVEIHTVADILSHGSGLGSSSALAVGALNALRKYRIYNNSDNMYSTSIRDSVDNLAKDACELEIHRMRSPIGEQDQYASAYGGINRIIFGSHVVSGIVGGGTAVYPVGIDRAGIDIINNNLLLFHTGIGRSTNEVVSTYSRDEMIDSNRDIISRMVTQVDHMKSTLEEGRHNNIGSLLHAGWELKKELSGSISNSQVDEMYNAARDAGATGGKLCGAGGGGHLLVYCPDGKVGSVRGAMEESGFKELEFNIDMHGTRIVYNDE